MSCEDVFLESPKHSPTQTHAKANLETNLLVSLCLNQNQIEGLHEVPHSYELKIISKPKEF